MGTPGLAAESSRRRDAALARVARACAGATTIQFRLDAPTGPPVGIAPVPRTGDAYGYATVNVPLTGVSGRRDVCLVLADGVPVATCSLD